MSDDLIQPTNLIELLAKAHKDGYQKALNDVQTKVNSVPVTYDTITIELLNVIINKLAIDN